MAKKEVYYCPKTGAHFNFELTCAILREIKFHRTQMGIEEKTSAQVGVSAVTIKIKGENDQMTYNTTDKNENNGSEIPPFRIKVKKRPARYLVTDVELTGTEKTQI